MKTGANRKKLVLNKISVARLDTDSISRAKGGDKPKPTVYYPPCAIIDTKVFDTIDDCY
jgi:hypothetical protein